jgi:two-component system response regulator YesN
MMYTAIVIDDEPWVIKTLVDSVKWSDYQFEVIGTATDSRAGLDMIRRLNPDIVFIDIRMPDMNGLECMKQAKAEQLRTSFIVVSGFAEFSYVQKSMHLGAVGYCLKPIDEDEIGVILRKVKGQLDARHDAEMPALIDLILEDRDGSDSGIAAILAAKGIVFTEARPLHAVYVLGAAEPLSAGGSVHLATLYHSYRKTILLMAENTDVPTWHRVMASRLSPMYVHLTAVMQQGGYKGIGISAPIGNYGRLRAAVEEAELAAHQYFLTGMPCVHSADEKGEADHSILREIYPALQRRDMAELDRLFDRCLNQIRGGSFGLKQVLLLYHTVMTTVIHAGNGGEDTEPYLIHDFEQLIERYGNAEEVLKDMKRVTIAYLGNMFTGIAVEIRSDSFKGILNHLHAHYKEEITLLKLSEMFYINPNYISQLFIKHLGKSFTGYLAELRIQEACRKLKTENSSIQKIASDVGIPDPYYFSKLFRKITGVSPREYRKSDKL